MLADRLLSLAFSDVGLMPLFSGEIFYESYLIYTFIVRQTVSSVLYTLFMEML